MGHTAAGGTGQVTQSVQHPALGGLGVPKHSQNGGERVTCSFRCWYSTSGWCLWSSKWPFWLFHKDFLGKEKQLSQHTVSLGVKLEAKKECFGLVLLTAVWVKILLW